MDVKPQIKLNDGNYIPVIALGTYMDSFNVEEFPERAVEAFRSGLTLGYVHFDTADKYGTHVPLGRALAETLAAGSVRRQDLFITTKLQDMDHRRERVVPALKRCLQELGLDYVDLFLIHSPVAMTPDSDPMKNKVTFDDEVPALETWKGMEECKELELTKSIGISNFNRRQIQEILVNCKTKPAVLQVEVHLYFQNCKLRNFCTANGIVVEAYSPLSKPYQKDHPQIADDVELGKIAARYKKTYAQVALRFLLQEGLVVLPKSIYPGEQKENLQVFDFALSKEDMEILQGLNKNYRITTAKKLWGSSKEYPFDEEY